MKTLSTVLTLLLGLTLGGAALAFMVQAKPHATLGTFSEILMPNLVTLVLMGLVAIPAFLVAWLLWKKEHKMASQLLGIVAVISPILIWQTVDAANVVLDSSAPQLRDTTLIRTYRRKNLDYFVLRSWRDPNATLSIESGDLVWERVQPGQPAVLTVHEGAFGKPYATHLRPKR